MGLGDARESADILTILLRGASEVGHSCIKYQKVHPLLELVLSYYCSFLPIYRSKSQ